MTERNLQNTHGVSAQDAGDLADAFEAAGARIAASLEGAAKRGELSFNDMAESVLKSLARLAVSEAAEGLFGGLLGGAGGGAKGGSQTINVNVSGATDANSFQRSSAQIGAHLARAVKSGAGRI